MAVAPTKIIFVVILGAIEFTNIIIVTKKLNKQVKGKFCNFTINRDHSNKK